MSDDKRVETDMAESGGEPPRSDLEEGWRKPYFEESLFTVEYFLSPLLDESYFNDVREALKIAFEVLTDRSLEHIVKLARDAAAERHPGLAPQEALHCELERLNSEQNG